MPNNPLTLRMLHNWQIGYGVPARSSRAAHEAALGILREFVSRIQWVTRLPICFEFCSVWVVNYGQDRLRLVSPFLMLHSRHASDDVRIRVDEGLPSNYFGDFLMWRGFWDV